MCHFFPLKPAADGSYHRYTPPSLGASKSWWQTEFVVLSAQYVDHPIFQRLMYNYLSPELQPITCGGWGSSTGFYNYYERKYRSSLSLVQLYQSEVFILALELPHSNHALCVHPARSPLPHFRISFGPPTPPFSLKWISKVHVLLIRQVHERLIHLMCHLGSILENLVDVSIRVVIDYSLCDKPISSFILSPEEV